MKRKNTFTTFKRLLKPYQLNIWILTLLNIFTSVIALIFAFYSKDLIDNVIDDQIDRFIFYAILLSSLLILNVVFQALFKYLLTKYTNKVTKTLKSTYFNHLLKSTSTSRRNYHSGALMTHLENDVELVSDGLMSIIPRFIFYTTRFIGAFIILLYMDPIFSVLFLSLGILMLLASRIIAPFMRKRHLKLQASKDLERSFSQESIENIDVIKSFESEEKITDKQANYQENVNQALIKKITLNIITSSGINLFFAFGYAFVLIFGGYQLQHGLSVGSLIAMIQLVQLLQSPFSGLSLLYPKYQHTIASIERLENLKLLTLDEPKEENISEFSALKASDLSFKYDHLNVINQLSFNIKKGQMIMIKGPSGTGKSTLMKLLLGLITPTSGHLSVKSQDKAINISSKTRSLFSYVPQDNLILSGSIRDNLNLFAHYDEDQLYQVLKDVSLDDQINQHPLKLDMKLNEKGKGLSEGQIQRLAIARALLKDAPILLLDEVTSSLDHQLEVNLLNHLKSLKGKTIILITHHDLSPDLFDQIITI